jgi:hypothetical protein
MGAKEPMQQEELSPTPLGGTHGRDFASPVQFVEPQTLDDTDGGVERGMDRTVPQPTIPAAVGHLFCQQVIGDGVKPVVVVLEVAKDGEHHPGDAGFAPSSPTIVDAAIVLQALLEQERTRPPRLAVRGGRPKSRRSSIG